MSFQGDISSLSLSDVFQNLATNQKTGTLTIHSGGTVRNILFREGKAVSYSDDQGFSIAEWLIEKEVIKQEHFDEALRRYKKAKKKSLGEILRDMEVISQKDYASYLSGLIQETIYEVLSFQEGTFEFLEGTEESEAHYEAIAAGLSFPAQSLLMEAARRSDDWQNVRRHIPSEDEIYLVPPSSRSGLLKETQDDVVREAVQLMDGTRTLRKVIAKLPYGRFDACRAIAQLIAEKKVRPLDGAVLPQFAKSNKDPRQAIACLRTILEREPNNRPILEKLAELHAKLDQRDESATCWKLLAGSYLDEGDLANGENCLKKSIGLNSKDLVAWQKLLETVRRGGDLKKLEAVASQFVERFKSLGLMEVVRDHLVDLLKVFPENAEFKQKLAEARFALGEHKESITELITLGLEHHKAERHAEAERVLTQVLKYDSGNQKAKKLIQAIKSGEHAKRKARMRKVRRVVLVASLAASLCAFLVYDELVRAELFQVTRRVYADSLLERGRYDEAADWIRMIERKYPLSYTTLREAALLRATLEAKSMEAKRKASGAAAPGPAPAKTQAPAKPVPPALTPSPAPPAGAGKPAETKKPGEPKAR